MAIADIDFEKELWDAANPPFLRRQSLLAKEPRGKGVGQSNKLLLKIPKNPIYKPINS
jgi:hypothetical protein